MNTSILTTTLAEFKTITGIDIDSASIKTDDLDYTINQIKSICKMYKEAHNLTFFSKI